MAAETPEAAAPRRWRPWRLFGEVAAGLLVVALIAAARLVPATSAGRAWITAQAEGARTGRLGRLHIEGLAGDSWTHFTLRRLTIADHDGVWLDARSLAVAWRPLDLIEGRVHVTDLAVGRIAVLRRFTLAPAGRPTPSPVSVRIDHAAMRVETAPAFSINRGLFDVSGAVTVARSGSPSGHVRAVSLLRPGDQADTTFDFAHKGHFTLQAEAMEARGGALAGALGLAADRDFQLRVHGAGKGRDGQIALSARSGDQIAAEAGGDWTAAGGVARGRIVLGASTLLAPYAAMLGPEAQLTVRGRRDHGDLYDLDADVSAQNIALRARGGIDVRRRSTAPGGLALNLSSPQPARIVRYGAAGPAALHAGLGGDAGNWVLAGAASLERPSVSGLSFARLDAPFRLQGGRGPLALTANLRAQGAVGPALPMGLLGPRPTAFVDVGWLGDGRVILRRLNLDGGHLSVAGRGQQGLLGALSFDGTARVTGLDAVRPGARGDVTAAWSAKQSGSKPWTFTLDARGDRLVAALGQIDHLLGPSPRLRAIGSLAKGVLKLEDATLVGAGGQISAAGLIGPAQALSLALRWNAAGPFLVGPLEIDGAARGTGDIGGSLAAPKADLVADFSRLDLPSLPLSDAHLVLSLGVLDAALQGHASLTATGRTGPASAAAGFSLVAAGVDVSDLKAAAGGATVAGSLQLRQGEPSRADLTFAVGPGAFLAAGHVAGGARVAQSPGGTTADLNVTANDVRIPGGPDVKSLHLTADGPLTHLPYKADGAGAWMQRSWRASGGGVFSERAPERTVTFAGAGRLGVADFKTVTPARISFAPNGLHAAADLAVGAGRADLELDDVAGAVRGHAVVAGLSLALLDPDYAGHIDGQGDLRNDGGDLGGDLNVRLSGLGLRGQKAGALIDATVNGALAHNVLTLASDLTAGKGSTAHLEATLPADTGVSPMRLALATRRPMSGRFSFNGDLAPFWDLTMGDGQTLGGRLQAAGTLAGTLADPRVIGTAALDGGRFQDSSTGLRLDGVMARATLSDSAIDVSRFDGHDGAKGSVSGAGRVDLQRDGASSFHLDLKSFRLIDNEIGQAAASGQITVNRAADGKVKLAGTLAIDRAQIAPRPPTPSGAAAMDVVEINRHDEISQAESSGAGRQPPVALEVALKAPGGIFIKGRGLNIELSLDARVAGTTANPLLSGEARVVRGDYDFAGKRFTLDESGVVRLASTPEAIRLDLTATRDDPTLTAVIRITGTAAKPIITLTSRPSLPKDEVLSQVLFGASASSLTGLEAAQLASALSGLASGGGFDVIGGIRNIAHLDRLAFTGGGAAGTTVAGGKYLTDKIYLELSGSAREGPGAQVEWRIKKHLAIVSRVTSQGDQQFSVRWRKDY